MDCLKNIIGITNTDCLCVLDGLTDDQKAAIKVSESGLFLDELEGGLSLRAVKYLDACQNFAQMALAARDTAIKKIYADIMVALSQKYKAGKQAFTGQIGRPSYTRTMNGQSQFQFLRLRAAENTDAVLKITGLRIIVDRVATFHVRLLKTFSGGNQGTEIMNVEITSLANAYTTIPLPNDQPLSLPLMDNGTANDYYLVWDRVEAGGANPKDIKIDCNCGSGNGFTSYLEARGGELTDVNMLGTKTTDEFTHGFSIDADIRCTPGDLICREYDRENAIALTMAWAIMYKAGEILIEKVMNSGEVNRYTMMNREYLWGKRNHFRAAYDERILYLSSVIDVSSSDCFICRNNVMYVGGILS